MKMAQINDFLVLSVLGLISTLIMFICLMPILGILMGCLTIISYKVYATNLKEYKTLQRRKKRIKNILSSKNTLMNYEQVSYRRGNYD